MNLWQRHERQRYTDEGCIILRFETGVEPAFRQLCLRFIRWVRKKYVFPGTIRIYVKDCEQVRLLSGRMAYGSFRWFDGDRPPYIRLPARINNSLREQYSDEDLYDSVLSSLVHELTHYFQWAEKLVQSDAVSERQANYYRYRLIETFCREEGLPY